MKTKWGESLQPTLWRTCRALANHRRLLLFRLLARRGPLGVQQAAHALRQSESLTSQHLRALNARGLLKATRQGRRVSYCVGWDKNVWPSEQLSQSLQHALQEENASIDTIYRAVTAFTHPRRLAIMRCIASGNKTASSIRSNAHISFQALSRHMKKLLQRGYVVGSPDKRYHVGRPTVPFARALLRLATDH